MRAKIKFFLLLLALAGLIMILMGLIGCGSDISNTIGPPVATPTAPAASTFVGSLTCKGCHPNQYAETTNHGHSHTFNKVLNGSPPQYPSLSKTGPIGNTILAGSVQLPGGIGWNDLSYIVGGFGWRAYYLNTNGYFIEAPDPNGVLQRQQFFLQDQTFQYNTAAIKNGTRGFSNCAGECHTTGWVEDPNGNSGLPHHNNLPGIWGNFSEEGVTCEACHGPGSRHVATQNPIDIKVLRDKNATGLVAPKACGDCHDEGNNVTKAPNGFLYMAAHERQAGLSVSPHVGLNCVDCHEPHEDTTFDQGGADESTCLKCHPEKAGSGTNHNSEANCVDCHMPYASFMGIPYNKYAGNFRVHLFKINPNPVSKESTKDVNCMFTGTGTSGMRLVKVNGVDQTTGINLDFACYTCHNDGTTGGTRASTKTLLELSNKAIKIHNP